MISATAAVLAAALSAAPSPSSPNAKPEAVDISAFKDRLVFLTDGKNHYVAVDWTEFKNTFSSADGKVFVRARVQGGGRNGDERADVTLWDPRMWAGDGQLAGLEMKNPNANTDGGTKPREYNVFCAKKTTALQQVSAADTKKLLETASFVGYLFTRFPEKLLRDDKGTYYLVDRFRSDDPSDRRDFRVFAGPKGGMKQLPLKDIVDDSQGMVLATKNGNLRLVTNADGKLEGKWVQGTATTPLVEVDLNRFDSARMVYNDLGPYTGQRLGTPCDDFM